MTEWYVITGETSDMHFMCYAFKNNLLTAGGEGGAFLRKIPIFRLTEILLWIMLWVLTHMPDLGMNFYRWSNVLRKQEWRTKWYNSTPYGQRFTSFLACGTRRADWIMSVFLRLDVGQTQLLHPVKCCWLTIRTCCIVQTMTSLQPEGLARPFRIATVLLQGDCCITL